MKVAKTPGITGSRPHISRSSTPEARKTDALLRKEPTASGADFQGGHRKQQNEDWLVTVSLESSGEYRRTDNQGRMEALKLALEAALEGNHGDGVILFPGGWFNAGRQKARTLYGWVEKNVARLLQRTNRHVVVCAGVDGRVGDYQVDQIALAVDGTGIIAMGRKFHPTHAEKGHIEVAPDHLAPEEGRGRIFNLNGKKYFLSVCYDGFGIRQKSLPNPGADAVLDLVHWFYPPGKGPSGEKYFARHGFAGASRQWHCPAFGAAVFYHRVVPPTWPTGVFWNQGNKSTTRWKYEDNPMRSANLTLQTAEGHALLRFFEIGR